jgi:pullulanase/glycogen debranching enzyme
MRTISLAILFAALMASISCSQEVVSSSSKSSSKSSSSVNSIASISSSSSSVISSSSSAASSSPAYRYSVNYYTTTWTAVNIHYSNDATSWTTVPGKAMSNIGGGWWNYQIFNTNSSIMTFCFNIGGSNWDNNNNNNFVTSFSNVWVMSEAIYTNNPLSSYYKLIVHYNNYLFSSPQMNIWGSGATNAVSSLSNDSYGSVFVITTNGGISLSLNFSQGASVEPVGLDNRLVGSLNQNTEVWVYGESKAIFTNNPVSMVSNPSLPSYTNQLGANIDGSYVNFVLFAPKSKKVEININGGAYQTMNLTPDGKFWWLRTTASANGYYYYRLDGSTYVSDPYAKDVTGWNSVTGCENCRIVDTNAFSWSDSSFATPAISNLIIYELHTEDFTVNANSGVADTGKFSGIAEKLSYLTNLGINAIEIMPPCQFQGGASYYSWGYMTRLFMVPSQRYVIADGVAELKALVNAAHNAGIAVLFDMVFNHTENNPNYLWAIDQSYYFNSWGEPSFNNLNSTREMTVRLIQDTLEYWMQQFHVDGFRLDMTGANSQAPNGQDCIDHGTLEMIATNLKSINSNVALIAENWSTSDSDIPSWSKWEGGYKGDASGSTRAQYNILLHQYSLATTYVWGNKNSGRFAYPYQSIMYGTSHDEDSPFHYLTGTLSNNIHLAEFGATIQLEAMSVPMIFMGEEMGRIYSNTTSTEPIDWSLLSANTNLFLYYQGLIAYRMNHPALRPSLYPTSSQFKWNILQPSSNIVAGIFNYDGTQSDNRIAIVYNYSLSTNDISNVSFPVDGSWTLVADGDTVNTNGLGALIVSNGAAEVIVPPQTAYIYQY